MESQQTLIQPAAEELLLERYRVLERLGSGGFGVVWRAHDELLHREVAVKRIWLGPEGDSERARREALAAARLSHPAIVALYEVCARDRAFYLISELVQGETLGQLIAARRLSDEQVLRIGLALARALAHAHARGVVHRDIKPHNVLVPMPFGECGEVAKLTDFGGASLAGEEALTRPGDVIGTLAYMAPEQSAGEDTGAETDLYSLALVLYEALCGTNPVRGPTPAATARRIGRRLESLSRHRRDLPPDLTAALDGALLPSPRSRGTLEDLTLALREALEQMHASHASPVQRMPRRRAAFARTQAARAPGAWRDPAPPQAGRREPESPQPVWREPESPQPVWREPECPQPFTRGAGPPPAVAGAQTLESRRDDGSDALEPRERRRAAMAFPRALWVAGSLVLVLWELAAGRAGLALVLAAALLPALIAGGEGGSARLPPGRLVCALAPVLGLIGLAGAFPALAGQARGAHERFVRGALGYWWLTLAAPLLGARLWLASPSALPSRSAWEGSLGLAASHVLAPALTLGVLLGAALWGAGALLLPWIVRGSSAALDFVAVCAWSAALASAAPILDSGLAAGGPHPGPRGALLGALLGGMIAIAARALRGPV